MLSHIGQISPPSPSSPPSSPPPPLENITIQLSSVEFNTCHEISDKTPPQSPPPPPPPPPEQNAKQTSPLRLAVSKADNSKLQLKKKKYERERKKTINKFSKTSSSSGAINKKHKDSRPAETGGVAKMIKEVSEKIKQERRCSKKVTSIPKTTASKQKYTHARRKSSRLQTRFTVKLSNGSSSSSSSAPHLCKLVDSVNEHYFARTKFTKLIKMITCKAEKELKYDRIKISSKCNYAIQIVVEQILSDILTMSQTITQFCNRKIVNKYDISLAYNLFKHSRNVSHPKLRR